jgi:uncharacterized protein YdiU (UPF0061 family)
MKSFSAANQSLDRIGWNWDNSYSRLPEFFFQRVRPASVPDPQPVILNFRLAEQLGLDLRSVTPKQAADLFAGQTLPPGSDPLAQAYAGHQFGGFTILGDGRAILLGEHLTPAGRRYDIQFKGSGQTPFSRRGDGKAALGPMLREFLISEAMDQLGIPSSRSLAVVTTGEPVYRERILTGAVLTRVAASHIRVGTFQYAMAHQQPENLRKLADHTISRHYPDVSEGSDRYLEFLGRASERQAALIAQWQLVGFIHGVMNTDNMLLSGETIDYGPCAFMDAYHPQTVFSSIDHQGRYAYLNQPTIAQWNLARLAETLLELINPDQDRAIGLASEVIHAYPTAYERYWLAGMRGKLGLLTEEEQDRELIQKLLDWMARRGADFTNTFRFLTELVLAQPAADPQEFTIEATDPRFLSAAMEFQLVAGTTEQPILDCEPGFRQWLENWMARLARNQQSLKEVGESMQQRNPALIPRNYFVEEALTAAQDQGNLGPFHRLLEALQNPFRIDPLTAPFRNPPPASCEYQTFCGT